MKYKVNYDKSDFDELKRLILEEKKDINSIEVQNLTKHIEKSFVQEMKKLNNSTKDKNNPKT